MTATQPKITPTQRRILAVLSDGEPHSREELIACMPDSEGIEGDYGTSAYNCLRMHISNLRKHLALKGQDVVCVKTQWSVGRRRPMYRQVRHLHYRRLLTK